MNEKRNSVQVWALPLVEYNNLISYSLCYFLKKNTLLKSVLFHYSVTCVDIAEDSSLMSCGFGDSNIRIWTLTPNKLRAVKQLEDLELIDKEAGG